MLISVGLDTPGLSSVSAKPLLFKPRLNIDESNTSVIVIEWGESPSNIAQSIVYEVDYTLTPFLQPSRDPIKEFVSLMLVICMHICTI